MPASSPDDHTTRAVGFSVCGAWCAAAVLSLLQVADALPSLARFVGHAHVLAIALTMWWTYRTYAALQALGFADLRFSPTWATAAYLVPIANLFVPYQVLREVCTRMTSGKSVERSLLLWWLAYLVAYGAALETSIEPLAETVRAVALVAVAATSVHFVPRIESSQTSGPKG